jgi:hypothetical protein
VKRALVETLAIAVCVLLGVLVGRAYDPAIPWPVYLGCVFGAGALLLVVGIRLEKHFDPENATGPACDGAGSQDSDEGQARGVKR